MDKLIFECKDMKNKEEFPLKYTGMGEDLSPQFSIKNLSPNARTLAVTLEDVSNVIHFTINFGQLGVQPV